MERIMKKTQLVLVSAALAIGMAAPASAGVNDPEIIIYRFPGVRDDGGATNTGIASLFHCTNFSGQNETLRLVTRNSNSTLLSNSTITITHLSTLTMTTHITVAYFHNLSLATGAVAQGTTAIAATSINIVCTAMTIDAANPKPDGVSLRGIRFNPAPGSQE
jgi:hypothetical protein